MGFFGKKPPAEDTATASGQQQYQSHVATETTPLERTESKSIFENLDPTNDAPMPPLNPREERAHKTLQRIQYLMDDSIKLPFINRRIGVDPIIGLMPVVGDFGSAVVSLAFVARAAPVLSKYSVMRMLTNVWIDSVVGVVPFIGDIFDIGWKANERNLCIFEDHMKVGADLQRSTDKEWIIRLVIGFFIICFVSTVLTLTVIVLLIMYFMGYFS